MKNKEKQFVLEDWQIGSVVVIQCMGHPKHWKTVNCDKPTKARILRVLNSSSRPEKDYLTKW